MPRVKSIFMFSLNIGISKLLLNLKNENETLLTTTLPQTPLVILPKSFFLLS